VVVIESEEVTEEKKKEIDIRNKGKQKKYNHTKSCSKLRIEGVENLKSETIKEVVEKSVEKGSTVTMDASRSHSKVKEVVEKVDERVTKPKDASKFLPWVHIAISNLKSRLRVLYHGVKEEFLQYYMDEFCHKFNRRYEKEKLFELLMETTISCRTNFRHRIYNKNLSPKCG